ncbi:MULTISPECIES: flagellar biosynthetic protein FliO [Vagococcus]|nr:MULTISPECIES: flagellar biosynthetic protein FliO [Vagococcus]
MSSIFLIFKSIVFLFAVIVLIRITLSYMNKFNQKQSKNIEILEKLTVGKESSMAIVLVCQKYYLMSMTSERNELIKELSTEEITQIKIQKMVDDEFREKRQAQIIGFCKKITKKITKKEIKNEETD